MVNKFNETHKKHPKFKELDAKEECSDIKNKEEKCSRVFESWSLAIRSANANRLPKADCLKIVSNLQPHWQGCVTKQTAGNKLEDLTKLCK